MALTDSLIYSYECTEASGNLLDSHSALTATETSGTIDSAAGLVNATSRDFESGDTEYFERASETALQAGDIECTWEVWVYLESTGSQQTALGKTGGSNFEYDIQARTDAGGVFSARVASAAGFSGLTTFQFDSLGTPTTATWYQLIVWHDPTGNTIKRRGNNGAVDSTAWTGGIYVGTDSLRVGNNAYGEYLDGRLGPVRYWKRILTAGEQDSLWNAGSGLPYASLAGGGGGGPVGPLAGSRLTISALTGGRLLG